MKGWLGIQSLDTSFVNSVHVKHWLKTSEIRDTGEERTAAGWKFKHMDFSLELVWKTEIL